MTKCNFSSYEDLKASSKKDYSMLWKRNNKWYGAIYEFRHKLYAHGWTEKQLMAREMNNHPEALYLIKEFSLFDTYYNKLKCQDNIKLTYI